MNKALIIVLILAAAGLVPGQGPSKNGTKKAVRPPATIAKASSPAGDKKKAEPAAVNPEPAATPAPESDQTRFDKAVAATAVSEKARLLRAFIDEFPESEHRPEAYNYLVTARAIVGEEKMRAGDREGAVASFKLAVDDAPEPMPERAYNEVILKIPANLFYRGEKAAAMEIARHIENKVAANAKLLLGVAAFYLSIENGTEARRVAESAVAVDPASAQGYLALGLAHRLNFELEDAAKAYAKALEVDAGSVPAQRGLADMRRALGHSADAALLYRAILASNEADTAARSGLVLALFEAGKRNEAEAELTSALERDPKNFPLLAAAGYWYAANKQPAKAVEHAQKAIDIEPRYVWSHIALGRGLMAQGKPLEAERALIKAKQYGNFPTLEYELAMARYQAGFYREAAEELAKSFTVRDGVIKTRLGGRVEREDRSFTDLLAGERRASIMLATAPDDQMSASKLKALLEFTRKAEETEYEVEAAALADEFTSGDDAMKVHRQLYAASLLLQKNLALPKAAELVKAVVGRTDAALEVASPSAAVMANELYESRAAAFSKNEVMIVPDIPRQTLSAILRGRVEELSGWTLFMQKNYPEATVRLKRAVAVLPANSAWWRSSMWRLGSVLEADGKDQEALESYIQSYKADRPSVVRYGVIESVYLRVNGSTDGLEQKLGPRPGTNTAIAAAPAQPVPEQAKADAANNTVSDAAHFGLPKVVPAKTEGRSPAAVPESETKTTAVPAPAEAARTEVKRDEIKTEPNNDARKDGASPVGNTAPVGETPVGENEKSETAKEIPVVEATLDPSSAKKDPGAAAKTVSEPSSGADPSVKAVSIPNTGAVKETVRNEEMAEREPSRPAASENDPSAKKELTEEVPAKAGPPREDRDAAKPTENVRIASPEGEKPSEKKGDTAAANEEKKNETSLPSSGPEPPAAKPSGENPAKRRVVVVDNLTGKVENNQPDQPQAATDPGASQTKRAGDPLFDPIVINVPSTWVPKKVEPKAGTSAGDTKAPVLIAGSGQEVPSTSTVRPRLVEGKEVAAERKCSMEVSEEKISLLNGGGSLGVQVSVKGEGSVDDVSASTNSVRDIEVRPEPEIEGVVGRRFYVIRSISARVGMYQVNFESPCGKKEVMVRVR
jgi:tetratricopeptide (TPR) repeat protein